MGGRAALRHRGDAEDTCAGCEEYGGRSADGQHLGAHGVASLERVVELREPQDMAAVERGLASDDDGECDRV